MNKTFKIKTEFLGAFDTPDHIMPVGSIRDNYTNISLINEVLQYFNNSNIKVLDLGCAGGQFLVDFLRSGADVVGIEGSSHVFNGPGKFNWIKLMNHNFFLCDITKPFNISEYSESYENNTKFDFIHCSEVMEHIEEVDLISFLNNVKKHLSTDGVFCCQISIDDTDPLHVSVFDIEKWLKIFDENDLKPFDNGISNKYFGGYIFQNRFRDHLLSNYSTSLYFCLKLKL